MSNSLSALRAYAMLEARDADRQADAALPRTMSITAEQRERWAAGAATGPFNRWLEKQVRDHEGRLSLVALHQLALQYGIDKQDEYHALNAGQQRMNLGNMLRRVVPKHLYEEAAAPDDRASPAEAPPVRKPASTTTSPVAGPEQKGALADRSVGELLRLYGDIMDELRRREVVRTGNSPVGDYAELIFVKAFGWTLERNSASGHDAVDGAGRRYQIKGRRLTSLAASRQLSAIRRLNDRTFDVLAAVLFDPSFKVTRAILVPHDVVAARARRTEHTNSWTFLLDDKVWREPGVTDVTAEIAVAASRL